MKRKVFRLSSICLTMALICSCLHIGNGNKALAKTDKNVSQVKVTNVTGKKLSVVKGKTFTLKTSVVAKKGKVSQKVTFKSNKPKIASVSSKGVVKGVKAGSAKITVISTANKSKKIQISVTVTAKAVKPSASSNVAVSKIVLDKTSLTLDLASLDPEDDDAELTYQLSATVTPSNATNAKLKWTCSNEEIAEVSSKGLVTAWDVGSVTITAVATDGSGVSAKCTITVIDSSDDGDDGDEDGSDDSGAGDSDTGNSDTGSDDEESGDGTTDDQDDGDDGDAGDDGQDNGEDGDDDGEDGGEDDGDEDDGEDEDE